MWAVVAKPFSPRVVRLFWCGVWGVVGGAGCQEGYIQLHL